MVFGDYLDWLAAAATAAAAAAATAAAAGGIGSGEVGTRMVIEPGIHPSPPTMPQHTLLSQAL